MRDLPAATTWPSASRAGAVDMSRSLCVVGGPRRRGEVLEERERRRELEHRVAVVVGVARRVHRAVAGLDPDVAVRRPPPGPRRPSRWRPGSRRGRVDGEVGGGAAGLGHGDHPAVVRGAVAEVPPEAEDDPAGVERQPRPLQEGGREWSPPGRRPGSARPSRSPCSSPTSSCAGLPLTSSSATTKISERASSITGVPVIPTVGEMSPQGSDPEGTGVPRWVDHSTEPVVAGERVRRCRSRWPRTPARPTRAVRRRAGRRGRATSRRGRRGRPRTTSAPRRSLDVCRGTPSTTGWPVSTQPWSRSWWWRHVPVRSPTHAEEHEHRPGGTEPRRPAPPHAGAGPCCGRRVSLRAPERPRRRSVASTATATMQDDRGGDVGPGGTDVKRASPLVKVAMTRPPSSGWMGLP